MRYCLNEPDASAEVFEEEVLAINLATGDYHSLRGGGVAIWRVLMAGYDTATAAQWLAARWGRDVEATRTEVEALGAQLAERLIWRAREDAAAVEAESPAWWGEVAAEYAEPVLETYADMQDLLLIDPIHEVDVTGWPHRPETKADT